MSFLPFRILYVKGLRRASARARRRSAGLRYGSSSRGCRISFFGLGPWGLARSERLRPAWIPDSREAFLVEVRERGRVEGERVGRREGLRPRRGRLLTSLIASSRQAWAKRGRRSLLLSGSKCSVYTEYIWCKMYVQAGGSNCLGRKKPTTFLLAGTSHRHLQGL